MSINNQRTIQNNVLSPTASVGSSVKSINDSNFKCIRSKLLLQYCSAKEEVKITLIFLKEADTYSDTQFFKLKLRRCRRHYCP